MDPEPTPAPPAAPTGVAATPERESLPAFAKPPRVVLDELGSGADGLTAAEVADRLARVGPNRLPDPPRDPLVKRVFKHFDDVLIYILLAAAVLKAILGEWIDFWVILAVAVISAMVGFIQEGRAEQALTGLKQMLSLDAQVRRDGEWRTVAADGLVPGDIVRLRSGDKVPADLRLLQAVNLRVEESALTGEAEPTEKSPVPVAPDAGVGDRTSMCFSGTIVSAGQGVGVVTATGPQAEIGRIQAMLADVEDLDTPLTREMKQFGKQLSLVILGMAGVMLVIGRVVHDFAPDELISAAIGFAVAAIPEGLPALVTITLALGVQQMARRNAIMRNLPAVETLGAVTTVCSDKTGTLTKNEMTVRHVVTRRGWYEVEGLGYQPSGRILFRGHLTTIEDRADLRSLVTVMAVANDSSVAQDDTGQWRVVGEPTEGALATLARKAGFDASGYTRIAVVPFESEHKYMAVLDDSPEGRRAILLKGAPDRVLDRCATEQGPDGRSRPLDREFWEAEVDRLGGEGLRVLAAAARPAPAEQRTLGHDDLEELVLIGLVGIVDPPRPEAIEAIETCHRAGIKVTMITGDHAGTAAAIAREMGISEGPADRAITGAELERASNEQLRALVRTADTFARTSPEHKIRLVKALQANGEVVAMTGDGVNDAPALKRADVGVAMGIKGTEATKEAADVVLADDNFLSIERAIEEGRRIYDNIQKSVVFLLPTNGAQSLVILVAVLLGIALPLSPVQILWINMVTAVTLSLALAYEPAEPDLMDRPPRDPRASILNKAYLVRIAYVSVLIAGATMLVFWLGQSWGWSSAESQTAAVTMLALGQVAYLFNARSLRESSLRADMLGSNRAVWIAVGVMLALQVVFVYAPFMHTWFGSAPLDATGWLVPIGLSVVIFVLVEAGKALLRRIVATPRAARPSGQGGGRVEEGSDTGPEAEAAGAGVDPGAGAGPQGPQAGRRAGAAGGRGAAAAGATALVTDSPPDAGAADHAGAAAPNEAGAGEAAHVSALEPEPGDDSVGAPLEVEEEPVEPEPFVLFRPREARVEDEPPGPQQPGPGEEPVR
ncbi:MAG TPA: HAD-IC family P-type ATPase [Candidatus Nanopelagicales bacterium]